MDTPLEGLRDVQVGSKENRCFTGTCQLSPAADIALELASAALWRKIHAGV
jgi:hypothetical protein